MPTLFQYAIFFLAALLCISLVLCVRESTDPAAKDKAPATPPADKAASPAQPAAAPLQRIEPRGIPDGVRIGEPSFPRGLSRAAADPAAAPLQRIMAPAASQPQAPLPLAMAPAASETQAPLPALPPFGMTPAAGEAQTPLLRTLAPLAGETSRSGPDAGASPLQRAVPAPAAQPTLLRMIDPAVPSVPAGPSRDPAEAAAQRITLGGEDAAGRGAAPVGGLRIDDVPAPAPSERDRALDQRNDTLWDLVVHLRDYVEQLRAERHTLHDEARQLRTALAEATEEVRLLRAAQAAANSNELSAAAADARPGEATRVGAGPNRLH